MNVIPIERELKVLEVDYKTLKSKLKNLGAKEIFKGWIHDIYFDYPERALYDAGIRIRVRNKNNEKIIFSFKDKWPEPEGVKRLLSNRSFIKKIVDIVSLREIIKARTIANIKKRLQKMKKEVLWNSYSSEELRIKEAKEIEFVVPGFEEISYILNVFGLQPIAEKKKHRVSYEILTDQGKVVFDFDKYDGIPWLIEIEGPSAEVIYQWIKKLGLQNNLIKTFGSRGLFAYYGKPYMELI